MTREIPLSQGKVSLVDDEDYERESQYRWHAHFERGNTFYAARNMLLPSGKRTILKMHRSIINAPNGVDVDHINGDGLDNRRDNLRVCTRSENMRNRGKNSNNTSGFKGVSWRKERQKWEAKIAANGTTVHLGLYGNPVDAAKAYDIAAREFFGEFACLNFQ